VEAIFLNETVAGLATRSLINTILIHSGERPIGEITQLIPQKTNVKIYSRGYRLDITVYVRVKIGNKDVNVEIVNIEFQTRKMNMVERGLLYGGRLLDENAQRGDTMDKYLHICLALLASAYLNMFFEKDMLIFTNLLTLIFGTDQTPYIEK
jgi:hypothetical protein